MLNVIEFLTAWQNIYGQFNERKNTYIFTASSLNREHSAFVCALTERRIISTGYDNEQ